MKIYLVNTETSEITQTFNNVKSWGDNFVVYDNNGYLGKIYCGSNEYFTDVAPIIEIIEQEVQDD